MLTPERSHAESKQQFERWLHQKAEIRKEALGIARAEAIVYTIPVVVHVIHSGEAIGTGVNIPDQQIESQIQVLTEDFRRMNADAANTPAVFQPVAADVEIEFVLAKQDPEGLPSSGIVRVNGQQPSWELTENYELKRISYWPAEDYLNIWVTDIGGSYLGYAQFPRSEQVDGLEDASDSRLTDGVVIDYRAFGSEAIYPPARLLDDYSLGRTTTHEVGHYFGLRHTWGDDSGGCTESDYVDDTPNQGGSTTGCPETNPTSCGSLDMIQNYMDYTDDACMNLFTLGQKERVRIILDNSPRRASLKTSRGAVEPVIVSNDLGVRNIISPDDYACDGSVIPILEIRNYGDNDITNAAISVSVDGAVYENASFNLDLTPLEIVNVEFNPITLTSTGNHTVTFEITSVNNSNDENINNNVGASQFTIPSILSLPAEENFNEGFPDVPGWVIHNPDGQVTWAITPADNGEAGNSSLFMNFYNYPPEGEYDTLLTPVFDLSTISFAMLSFDRAYAIYPGIEEEGLIIKISTDCGQTFENTIYESYGSELATVPETAQYYSPAGAQDWERECLLLNDYAGLSNIRFAFITKNMHGNNLYLDNITIDDQDNASNLKDMSISSLAQPALVSCQQDVEPVIIIKNQGCTIESDFSLNYQFDEGAVVSDQYSVDTLKPGQSLEITLENLSFDPGEHSYSIELTGTNDSDTTNDGLSGKFYINNARDQLPVREDFENFPGSEWQVANMKGGATWELTGTNKGTSLYLNSETNIAEDEWLVSPTLDFSAALEATLSFDLAYSPQQDAKDDLKIQVSTNCGISYEDVIFNRYGEDLTTGDFMDHPQTENDWSRITVNMNQYLGEENIRIAFIATNAEGNNIYLDNIETFVTPHEVTDINEIYPNPSEDGIINITFDLPQKETIRVTMYDTSGRILFDEVRANTLNQTYTYDQSFRAQGIYIIKVVGESFSYVKRIMLRP